MQYKINLEEPAYNDSVYSAEVVENDISRRISVKENDQTKCYVLDENGRLVITINGRNIEMDYEEAQFIMMGLMVEAFDIGVEAEVIEVV